MRGRLGISPDECAAGNRDDEEGAIQQLDLKRDEAEALVDAYEACDVDLRESMLEGLAADAANDEGVLGCYEVVLTDEVVRFMMITTITDGPDALGEAMLDEPDMERAVGALMGCALTGAVEPDDIDHAEDEGD